jgi:SAM-dependent methyltransferase
MPLTDKLRATERTREAYWLRCPATSPSKFHWRAVALRHCFHVLPGENPLTTAVFNDILVASAERRQLSNVEVVRVHGPEVDFEQESFDYIIGTAILCHELYAHNLRTLIRLLKPGRQILFFEANHWNPQVFSRMRCLLLDAGLAMLVVRRPCGNTN